MKYEKDSANNKYLEIPFGWGSESAKLRLTINKKMQTVRICKKDESGKVFQGPEPDLEYIPKLIEVLAKIHNDYHENKF